MKKLLLLLLTSAVLLISSCSSNDDNEEKGYLTDLESAKHGIIGSWMDPENEDETYLITFDETTMTISGDESGEDFVQTYEFSYPYSVIMQNGRFYTAVERKKRDDEGNVIGTEIVKDGILVLTEEMLVIGTVQDFEVYYRK